MSNFFRRVFEGDIEDYKRYSRVEKYFTGLKEEDLIKVYHSDLVSAAEHTDKIIMSCFYNNYMRKYMWSWANEDD